MLKAINGQFPFINVVKSEGASQTLRARLSTESKIEKKTKKTKKRYIYILSVLK